VRVPFEPHAGAWDRDLDCLEVSVGGLGVLWLYSTSREWVVDGVYEGDVVVFDMDAVKSFLCLNWLCGMSGSM
jgi:hypothetical protein